MSVESDTIIPAQHGATEPAPAPFDETGAETEPPAPMDHGENVTVAEALVTVHGITDVGSVRTNNEDALAVVNVTSGELVESPMAQMTLDLAGQQGVLLAVSDGMGGQNAGEVASALVLEATRQHLRGHFSGDDPAASLRGAVEHANAMVIEAASDPGRTGMGATVVAMLLCGGTAYTAEVGDSRAYLLRGGELTQLTHDQTQIQLLIDKGLLTLEDAKKSHARSVLLQACGTVSELIVAQRRLALRNGDRLLLCSDGLTLHVTDPEIRDVLAATPSLDEGCGKLVALALERGGNDNVTVLAAQMAGGLMPPIPGESLSETLETLRAFTPGE